ncbi:MAG: TetR/AcrR family transcriptional regulator [Thermoleophilia bacterium]|nr:TetR/AcrR family transcriptional regulator [Thermoleophilia bacterium]
MTRLESEDGSSVETATRILDVAERLAQTRGFNGFSYANVAAELGLTKATLHYHYPSKARLGEALINRYSTRFAEALAAVDASDVGAPAAVEAYIELHAAVLRGDRMCLCGMFAAEYETLPVPMQVAVCAFFDANEAWPEQVLELGRGDGPLHFSGSACEEAASSSVALKAQCS